MLCACRNGSLWLRLVILALAVLLALAGLSTGGTPWERPRGPTDPVRPPRLERADVEEWIAVESNRSLVRRVLARGAILVAHGTEMEQKEFVALERLLIARECLGREELLREEVMALRSDLKASLMREMPTEADRILARLTSKQLLHAMGRAADTECPTTFVVDEFVVEVGFETYRYWQVRISKPTLESPPPRWRNPAEKLLGLPSTRQVYLRLMFRDPMDLDW